MSLYNRELPFDPKKTHNKTVDGSLGSIAFNGVADFINGGACFSGIDPF
ncbi:MAG: hypothetical protein K1Y36_21125 [Blastocatellia bacterium]|nr:hypothetical protein [Blastocatellia bacterium]